MDNLKKSSLTLTEPMGCGALAPALAHDQERGRAARIPSAPLGEVQQPEVGGQRTEDRRNGSDLASVPIGGRGEPVCVLPPHPSPLPWGEGESLSNLELANRFWLVQKRATQFPLPKGEGQGEGKPNTSKPE